jgi:hypothetical protein
VRLREAFREKGIAFTYYQARKKGLEVVHSPASSSALCEASSILAL